MNFLSFSPSSGAAIRSSSHICVVACSSSFMYCHQNDLAISGHIYSIRQKQYPARPYLVISSLIHQDAEISISLLPYHAISNQTSYLSKASKAQRFGARCRLLFDDGLRPAPRFGDDPSIHRQAHAVATHDPIGRWLWYLNDIEDWSNCRHFVYKMRYFLYLWLLMWSCLQYTCWQSNMQLSVGKSLWDLLLVNVTSK